MYADSARVTLKYTDQALIVQGSTGGANTNYSFSINDPGKCNITAGSGVAQGWAVYSGQFQRLVCHGSRIHWRIRGLSPGGGFGNLGTLGATPAVSALFCGVLVPYQSGVTPATSVVAASVQKYASKRFDWPRNRTLDGTSGYPEPTQQNPAELWRGTHSMSMSKLDGEPNLRQSQYETKVNTSPTAVGTWYFDLQDILADTTAKGVWLAQVELHYDCTFYDRVVVSDVLRDTRLAALMLGQSEDAQAPERKEREREEKKELPQTIVPRASPVAPPGYVLVKSHPLC